MTELFPRLEASNTAVGGRPGWGGWRVRRCSFVSSLSIADRASRPRIGNLNGHRMGRMPQLGCRRLREPTVHVYMSRQGRTCIRQSVEAIRDGAGATGRPAERQKARRARPLGSGAETTPPSGRAREARKNSTGEARTGVWSCSNCKLLRGRSRAEVPEDTGRLSEGHGDHTDWTIVIGSPVTESITIPLVVSSVANLLVPVKRHRGSRYRYRKRRVERCVCLHHPRE
jgi:hypothetical protein